MRILDLKLLLLR